MQTNIVLPQVINIISPQGKARFYFILNLLFVNEIVLKFAYLVIVSDHIPKYLNILALDSREL